MITINQILFFHCLIGWAIGQQVFCPGDQVSISCNSSERVVWSGTIFDGQCPPNNKINIQGITTDNVNGTYTCGSFTVTVTDFGPRTTNGGVEFMGSTSLLTFSVVSNALDQRTFECVDGSQVAVTGVLSIPVIPTPTIFVSQDSLTAVTVTLTVEDDHCASLYFVEVTQIGSSDPPIVMNSSSPLSIIVDSLDLCRNNYSVVSFVQAPSGMLGDENASPKMIQVDLSELQGVDNVKVNTPSILVWTQLSNMNTLSHCINGYTISWSDGQATRNVEATNTTISATLLNANGFPYCQNLTVTVTPNTRVGPVYSGADFTNVLFQQPGLVAPEVQAMFTQSDDGIFQIIVGWKPISVSPTRLYGFVKVGAGECQLKFPGDESGGLESQIVSGAGPGDQYRVCVEFTSNDCAVSTTITKTIPQIAFRDTQTTSAGDNGFSITVTLPLSLPLNISRLDLSIYSTIDPPDDRAMSAIYPASSQQHVVLFEGLIPGTTYTYDIRVVLRNDSTKTAIGLPVTGLFTVPACGTVCVTVVVVVCVLVVVVTVLCLAVCFGYKYKNRSKDPKEKSVRSSKSKDAEKHELTRSSPPPAGSLYADPKSIEHQAAPGTEDQYAMVDRKVKKNTKPKPTPPEALYQDPNTIEHKTAASGDTYAVVDKPKRSSKKKGGPDVVPPASEGLTYADIDLSSKRPKPGSGRQAPQQPGEYPKEHPVEYSSVDHGNTSQL